MGGAPTFHYGGRGDSFRRLTSGTTKSETPYPLNGNLRYRARSTQSHTALIFRAGQVERIPQYPQQRGLRRNLSCVRKVIDQQTESSDGCLQQEGMPAARHARNFAQTKVGELPKAWCPGKHAGRIARFIRAGSLDSPPLLAQGLERLLRIVPSSRRSQRLRWSPRPWVVRVNRRGIVENRIDDAPRFFYIVLPGKA